MKIVCTSAFLKGLKRLKKDHKESLIKEIDSTVEKLSNLEITTQKSNHKLHNPQGLRDIHIAPDLILLYKYDEDKKTLTLDLQLYNLTNHDNLGSSLRTKYTLDKDYTIKK